MRGLTGEALCPRLAGQLQVLAVVPGECSGGPSLGSLTALGASLRPPVREEADIPRAWCVGNGAVGPGGRGRKEKDGHAAASPQASGGGRAFSSGNPSLDSPRRHRPFAALARASGKWASSGAPLWAPRPGQSQPRAPGFRGGGGEAEGARRCRAGLVRALGQGPGFESPLRPTVRRLSPHNGIMAFTS